MATLKAMFKLYDSYSRTADVVERKTQKATDKILKASGATDKFNMKLAATGVSAGKASSGLNGLISKVITVAGIMKGANITDEYTNTAARLGLITDNLQEQKALQEQIYAAAERSRGTYTDMAAAVAKMGINAGEAFGGNTEQIVRFTELMQKSFRLGGASSSEQTAAMQQLTQAMASGQLQGDEFKSIRENAPMFAKAIEDYMKNVLKLEGNIKEWSSEGLITAEVMKNSLFRIAGDIDKKASELPLTFGDYWNAIKRGAMKAFAPVVEKINEMINTEKFKRFANSLINGFDSIAKGASKALDAISDIFDFVVTNWDKIDDVVYAAAAAWGAYELALQGVRLAQWALDFASMINPIGLTIILVAALAAIFVLLWEKCEWFRHLYTSMWKTSVQITAVSYDNIVTIFNAFRVMWNRTIEGFKLLVTAVKIGMSAIVLITAKAITGVIDMFSDLIDALGIVIKGYNALAKAAGKETIGFDITAEGLTNAVNGAANVAISAINGALSGVDSAFDKAMIDKPMQTVDQLLNKQQTYVSPEDQLDMMLTPTQNKLEPGPYSMGYLKGQQKQEYDPLNIANRKSFDDVLDYTASKIENFTISGLIKGFFGEAKSTLSDLIGKQEDFYTNPEFDPNKPKKVKGTGSGGKLPVEMSNEDLKYLRDIAEREYINKFSTATLAPNVVFNFGDVHETADVEKIKGTIEMMMREEIAVAAEGAY